MLKTITLSSVILAGTTSLVSAGGMQDPTIAAPPMAPAPVMMAPTPVAGDWTGFYLGGSVGTGDVTIGTGTPIDASNFGVHAGYNYGVGNIIVGGELEYSRLDFEAAGDDFDASVLRLKGRVGYDAGVFMPYATAGAAQLTIEDGAGVKDTGYFYGAGVDYAINDNFRIGGEILQHEFEDFNGGGADIAEQTLGLRVSYSF